MIRGTTPPIVARIKNVDLTLADSVYVTIKQFGNEIELTGNDLAISAATVETEVVTTISFYLPQETSLALNVGRAAIQANWLYTENGETLRGATKVACMEIDEQLLGRVIE